MSITEEMKNQLVRLVNQNAAINDDGAFPQANGAFPQGSLQQQLSLNQLTKSQLCRDYSAGFCENTFAHGTSELLEAPDYESASSMCAERQAGTCDAARKEGVWPLQWKERTFRKQFEKTQLCRYASVRKCKTGKACPFAHGEAELTAAPDLRKTSMCKQWKSGECKKSSQECRFAHGVQDLRMTPMFQVCVPETSVHRKNIASFAPHVDGGHIPTIPGLPPCQIPKSAGLPWTSGLPGADIQHRCEPTKLMTPTMVISHIHFPVSVQESEPTTMNDADQLESPSFLTGHSGGCLQSEASLPPMNRTQKPWVPQARYQ